MKLSAPPMLLLLCAPLVWAQPPTPAPDKMIDDYLRQETGKLHSNYLDGARSLKEWEGKLPRLRREYLDMLGLWPLPEKSPLKATITGTVERDGVSIEKLHFQSRPGLYVTGNLYKAKGAKGRLPTILYVCGHSGRGRDGNKTAFQDHGMWFARNGYVCLIIDTLQLGEVKGVHHGTYNLGRWWWHSAGYTPAGVECWNGIRAIDYLVSCPDVDPEKIGVTGISGGAASTVWIAAADERVKVAVPVSGMSDLESYVSNKVINGHCDCMFLVNSHAWEWTTIAALIAPRPLLFANSDNDSIFPMDGNRRIFARLKEVYKFYDKADLVQEHVSKGGHDYRPDLRVAVFRFLNKHLQGDKGEVKDAEDNPLAGKELRVFPEDKDLPADQVNDRLDETFVPRARLADPPEEGRREWVGKLMTQLVERSFHGFPVRIPAAEPALPLIRRGGISGVRMVTEDGIEVLLSNPVQAAPAGVNKGVLIVLGDGDEDRMEVPAWAAAHVKGAEVRLLVPRGGPGRAWTRKNPPNYVERSHALLGRTVDAGRVWDTAAVVRHLTAKKKSWVVCGRGPAGVIGAYAALFEEDVAGVVAVEPTPSHVRGPHFLGVLRVLDVPDALGLLAPRPLTLAGAKEKAFDRTAELYRKAGAADKLERK